MDEHLSWMHGCDLPPEGEAQKGTEKSGRRRRSGRPDADVLLGGRHRTAAAARLVRVDTGPGCPPGSAARSPGPRWGVSRVRPDRAGRRARGCADGRPHRIVVQYVVLEPRCPGRPSTVGKGVVDVPVGLAGEPTGDVSGAACQVPAERALASPLPGSGRTKPRSGKCSRRPFRFAGFGPAPCPLHPCRG